MREQSIMTTAEMKSLVDRYGQARVDAVLAETERVNWSMGLERQPLGPERQKRIVLRALSRTS